MFGTKETVAHLTRPGTFDDAKLDLDAAFEWAKSRRLPVVLWGSSYSAALVFKVAAEHNGEVSAVMAFSPDEDLADTAAVKAAAARVRAPVYDFVAWTAGAAAGV